MPPWAISNSPFLVAVAAGKSSLHVPEEFTLQELGGNRAAVDRDEGPVAPGTQIVNGLGDQFLPGTALPRDQNRAAARAHLGNEFRDPPDRLALADDVLEVTLTAMKTGLELAILQLESPLPDAVLDDQQQLFVAKRFGHEVERSQPGRLHRVFNGRIGRDHDDGQVRIQLQDLLQRLKSADAGKHEIQKHQIHRLASNQLDALLPRGSKENLVTAAGDDSREDLPHDLFVVDDQNRGPGCH